MEVPQLIIDLAIMLTTAAVVTIVFKKLRIPTILGYIVAGFLIGPNFPLFWQKNELNFYAFTPGGEMRHACSIKSHYVTVTGMDDSRFRISSWGREYYIDRQEYFSYIRRHSGSLVSNIVFIRSI
jgi:hypothetical protein